MNIDIVTKGHTSILNRLLVCLVIYSSLPYED